MADPESPRLAAVRTADDLHAALGELRKRTGLTYAQIIAASRASASTRLAKSTVGDAFSGRSLPTEETLAALLLACGVKRAELAPWLAARARAERHPGDAVPTIETAGARELGIHAAIQVDAGFRQDLPAYVPRDGDSRLRAVLLSAREIGGFVLLVGGSSVGKTRSAYETVKEILPDWRLLQPDALRDIESATDAPLGDTVIWVDEIQRFIAEGLDAPLVRRMVRARCRLLLIGTLWPERYLSYIAPASDLYRGERELLRQAHVIDVPSRLSAEELARAGEIALVDPRIAAALKSDAGLVQTLAAGPELVRCWENAPSPYAHALITAAVDARLLGVPEPSSELLRDAMPGYLSSTARASAPHGWFETAIAYATTQVLGATAPLRPVGREMGYVDGYRVADYLLHHVLHSREHRLPPPGLWRSCLANTFDGRELLAVGSAAYDRAMLGLAREFFHAAVQAGSVEALYCLVSLLSEQGREHETLAAWRLGAEHDIPQARERLAFMLENEGRLAEVETIWRQAAEAGDGRAVESLIELLVRTGQVDEARKAAGPNVSSTGWARLAEAYESANRLGEAADAWALASTRLDAPDRRAQILCRLGDVETAVKVLRDAAASGNWQSRANLVHVLDRAGRVDEAIQVLREGLQAGEFNARHALAAYLSHHGRTDEAVELWIGALVTEGDAESWTTVTALLEVLEDHDGLERVLRWGRAESMPGAGEQLEDLLRRTDRYEQALATCRESVRAGDPFARRRLCRMLQEAGRFDEALEATEEAIRNGERISVEWLAAVADGVLPADAVERTFRLAAEAGNTGARSRLAELLQRQDRNDEAVDVWRAGHDAGEVNARHGLTEILCRLNRTDEAIDIMRRSAAAGDRAGLIDLLISAGEAEEALIHLEEAARDGVALAWRRSAELLSDRGEHDRAVQVWRSAVEADVPHARESLTALLLATDRHDDAEALWREAVGAGVLGARRKLVDLLLARREVDGAITIWREAVREGKPFARIELARLLHREGRGRAAMHELYAAIAAGEPYARHELYHVLSEEGATREAEDILRNGVSHPLDHEAGVVVGGGAAGNRSAGGCGAGGGSAGGGGAGDRGIPEPRVAAAWPWRSATRRTATGL